MGRTTGKGWRPAASLVGGFWRGRLAWELALQPCLWLAAAVGGKRGTGRPLALRPRRRARRGQQRRPWRWSRPRRGAADYAGSAGTPCPWTPSIPIRASSDRYSPFTPLSSARSSSTMSPTRGPWVSTWPRACPRLRTAQRSSSRSSPTSTSTTPTTPADSSRKEICRNGHSTDLQHHRKCSPHP